MSVKARIIYLSVLKYINYAAGNPLPVHNILSAIFHIGTFSTVI